MYLIEILSEAQSKHNRNTTEAQPKHNRKRDDSAWNYSALWVLHFESETHGIETVSVVKRNKGTRKYVNHVAKHVRMEL
jgi:hypothetical protein